MSLETTGNILLIFESSENILTSARKILLEDVFCQYLKLVLLILGVPYNDIKTIF